MVWLGVDGGESHCWTTVIAQRQGGRLHILGALCDEASGARQHLQHTVLPWLGERMPWAITRGREQVQVRYDLPSNGTWVASFHKVATLSWITVALLVADVGVAWVRRRAAAAARTDGTAGEV